MQKYAGCRFDTGGFLQRLQQLLEQTGRRNSYMPLDEAIHHTIDQVTDPEGGYVDSTYDPYDQLFVSYDVPEQHHHSIKAAMADLISGRINAVRYQYPQGAAGARLSILWHGEGTFDVVPVDDGTLDDDYPNEEQSFDSGYDPDYEL